MKTDNSISDKNLSNKIIQYNEGVLGYVDLLGFSDYVCKIESIENVKALFNLSENIKNSQCYPPLFRLPTYEESESRHPSPVKLLFGSDSFIITCPGINTDSFHASFVSHSNY